MFPTTVVEEFDVALSTPAPFFTHLRNGLLGPKLDESEIEGVNALLAACEGWRTSWTAYALATAYHETNATMQPVREAYWLSEAWRKKNLHYWPYYGRGYVQLTWLDNYKRADKALALGGAMLTNLDLAMRPDIAAKVMREGMVAGWFAKDKSGVHSLARHLPADLGTLDQFKEARRIINGVDDNLLIARHALQFQAALAAGGWA